MAIFSLIIFLMMVTSLFLLLDFTPKTFSDELFNVINPKESLKFRISRTQSGKKRSLPTRVMLDIKHMLDYTHQSQKFSIAIISSAVLAILGIVISVVGNNPFLIFPLSLGLCSIPYIVIKFYSYSYIRKLQEELSVITSIVTASYIRSSDLIKSVQENIVYARGPVKKVLNEFVMENKMINPNLRDNIDHMRDKIDDNVFKEWCNALKKCVENDSLKYTLPPIVDKYSKLRQINLKARPQINSMKDQLFGIILITYINFPLLKLMSNESNNWYAVLTGTVGGKLVCAGVCCITLFSVLRLVQLVKPSQYQVLDN